MTYSRPFRSRCSSSKSGGGCMPTKNFLFVTLATLLDSTRTHLAKMSSSDAIPNTALWAARI